MLGAPSEQVGEGVVCAWARLRAEGQSKGEAGKWWALPPAREEVEVEWSMLLEGCGLPPMTE